MSDRKRSQRPRAQESPADLWIGSRVRTSRLCAGMTQTELAEKIGVSMQQVQKYECGINKMSAGMAFTASRAMGVPIEVLLGGDPDEDPNRFALSGEMLELFMAYRKIRDAGIREEVRSFVSHMLEIESRP